MTLHCLLCDARIPITDANRTATWVDHYTREHAGTANVTVWPPSHTSAGRRTTPNPPTR